MFAKEFFGKSYFAEEWFPAGTGEGVGPVVPPDQGGGGPDGHLERAKRHARRWSEREPIKQPSSNDQATPPAAPRGPVEVHPERTAALLDRSGKPLTPDEAARVKRLRELEMVATLMAMMADEDED